MLFELYDLEEKTTEFKIKYDKPSPFNQENYVQWYKTQIAILFRASELAAEDKALNGRTGTTVASGLDHRRKLLQHGLEGHNVGYVPFNPSSSKNVYIDKEAIQYYEQAYQQLKAEHGDD